MCPVLRTGHVQGNLESYRCDIFCNIMTSRKVHTTRQNLICSYSLAVFPGRYRGFNCLYNYYEMVPKLIKTYAVCPLHNYLHFLWNTYDNIYTLDYFYG